MLIVNPWHWLDEEGFIPAHDNPKLRRNITLVALLIEYGGPLDRGYAQETLVPCRRRPQRRPCEGFLWVTKVEEDRLLAFCPLCRTDQVLIDHWQDTLWADGPPAPLMLREG